VTWAALLHWVVLPLGLGHALLVGWFLPYAFATPWNGLKSIADHFNNRWKGDRFHTATTVRTHALVTLAWSGLNHHLDHHLYPRVPGPALPKLHALLKDDLARRQAPVFDGYAVVFWRAFLAGPTYVDDGQAFLVDARAESRRDGVTSAAKKERA
jgi:fatty acid desaturase